MKTKHFGDVRVFYGDGVEPGILLPINQLNPKDARQTMGNLEDALDWIRREEKAEQERNHPTLL